MVDYSGEKEANNTSNYLANAFIFSILLAAYSDEVIEILSDQKIYNPKNKSTKIYNGSKKGAIKIYLRNTDFGKNNKEVFSEFLYSYYLLFKDKVFESLTTIVNDKFEDEFDDAHNEMFPEDTTKTRFFLFNDECLTIEIKEHCLGYWYAMGKPIKKSLIVNFMKAFSMVTKSSLESHCKTIDIAEQDACDPIDRTFFEYFDGISVVYDYTKADPYWQTGKIRTPQNVRNSWKKSKIPTNMIIYWG